MFLVVRKLGPKHFLFKLPRETPEGKLKLPRKALTGEVRGSIGTRILAPPAYSHYK